MQLPFVIELATLLARVPALSLIPSRTFAVRLYFSTYGLFNLEKAIAFSANICVSGAA